MWLNRMRVQNVGIYKAVTLLEVLISLSLGSFLLLLFSSLYRDFYLSQTKQTERNHLQQTSHQLLGYVQQHIQHIGYQGAWNHKSNFDLFKYDGKHYRLNNATCLVFFYDLDSNGCLGSSLRSCLTANNANNTKDLSKEVFGFKLENRQLWVYQVPKKLDRCAKSECQTLLSACEQKNGWERVLEKPDHAVEKLQFQWEEEPKLLKTELILSSLKYPDVQYQIVAYSYILNAEE